jgi:hypothetical protein
MRRAIAVVTAVIAAAIAAWGSPATAAPPVHAAGVRDCHTWAYYPNVLISSVRNMRCKRAARDMRRYDGPINERFTTPGGFRCKQVSGVPEGGQWRCVRGTKAYRFEFGD